MSTLFLDTTIQVARFIDPPESLPVKAVEALLGGFDSHLASSFSRLEFKRVVICNFALALRYLTEEASYFLALRRATRLRKDRLTKLLVNILAFTGIEADKTCDVVPGEGLDAALTARAKAYLRNTIPFLWIRFNESVDHLVDNTACERAREEPKRTARNDFDCRISVSLCKKMRCRNANFFREQLPRIRSLCSKLEELQNSGQPLTGELKKALAALRKAETNPQILLGSTTTNTVFMWVMCGSILTALLQKCVILRRPTIVKAMCFVPRSA